MKDSFNSLKINTPIEGNLGISNLYIWRGMSQTNNIGNPAIFGGLDSTIFEKISFGTWVSNVSFADQTSYEWDIYGSYSNRLATFPNISYELGAIYYAYPNTNSGDSIDFSEFFVGMSFRDFTFQYNLLLTGPSNTSIGDDSYMSVQYSRKFIQEIQLITSVGYYKGKINITNSQWDYMVGLQKNGLTFATIGTSQTNQKPNIIVRYDQRIF